MLRMRNTTQASSDHLHKGNFMKRTAVFLLILLGSLSLWPAAAQNNPAKWTIIYYMALDNDLEPFAINDLMEMQAVGSSDDVNIIVQFDRAEGYEETFGDWTDARRFHVVAPAGNTSSGDFAVSKDTLVNFFASLDPEDFGLTQDEFDQQIDAIRSASQEEIDGLALQNIIPLADGAPMIPLQLESLESVGEINHGDPQYLIDFALWTIQNYPAEHYGLFISDHGGGWEALANDESEEGDALTLPEIDTALAAITTHSSVSMFDFIALDACLEAQLEIMKTLAPYAHYAIASEQTIPGAGYNYVRPMGALVSNPDITAVEFGQAAIDGYIEFYSALNEPAWGDYNLSLIDLSQVDNVIAAVDAFSAAVQANPEAHIGVIGDARNNTQFFGGETPDEADSISSVDLMHFMALMIQLSPDDSVKAAAQGVIDAAQKMVLYHKQVGLPGANGLTIFFPRNGDVYNDYGSLYPQEVSTSMAGWQTFLSTFYGTASTVINPDELRINITQVLPSQGTSNIYDPPVLLFDMNGQNIVDVSFIVLLQLQPDSAIMLDYSTLVSSTVTADGESIEDYPDGSSSWEFTWNVEMPVINDGSSSVATVLLAETGPNADDSVVRVSGIYHPGDGSDPRSAYMVFDTETQTFSALWLVSEGAAPFTIKPRPADTFEPTFRFVNAQGEVEFLQSGTLLNLNAPSLRYDYTPAETGDYTMILRIEDVAGNISVSSASFSIDNTGLDPAYRGFKDISFGVNFLFPWGWSDPIVQLDENDAVTLIVTDPEGDITIYVESYEADSEDAVLDTKLDEFTNNLEDFAYDEPEPIEVGDNFGYIVTYSYTSDGAEVLGTFAVLYVEENGLGYSLDLDSSPEKLDEADLVFASMLNSLTFFPPVGG
jgi:hypothetical protein